jgi:hypothetical protein
LDAKARYLVRNLDAAGPIELTGQELSERGLLVVLPDRPLAAIVTYHRLP